MNTFLDLLIEFGLLREDYKHRKKISIKEKEDGVKRPFQKYYLQPSSLIILSVLVIGSLSALLFFTYRNSTTYAKHTEKEIFQISNALRDWKHKFGSYPMDLDELLKGRPLRQNWLTDSWYRSYQYIPDNDKNSFILKSPGPDGKFDTYDDILSQ